MANNQPDKLHEARLIKLEQNQIKLQQEFAESRFLESKKSPESKEAKITTNNNEIEALKQKIEQIEAQINKPISFPADAYQPLFGNSTTTNQILQLPLSKIIDLYRDCPEILEAYAQRVTIDKKHFSLDGNTTTDQSLTFQANPNGNFWVIQLQKQGSFLFPRPNDIKRMNRLSMLDKIFELDGRNSEPEAEFDVVLPAKLAVIRLQTNWLLEKKGQLSYAQIPLNYQWQKELNLIRQQQEEISQQIKNIAQENEKLKQDFLKRCVGLEISYLRFSKEILTDIEKLKSTTENQQKTIDSFLANQKSIKSENTDSENVLDDRACDLESISNDTVQELVSSAEVKLVRNNHWRFIEKGEFHKKNNDATDTEVDFDIAEYHNYGGMAMYNLRNYKDAIDDYNKAIEINPNNADYYNNRANAKRKLEDYQGAIDDYTKAMDINPSNTTYYSDRGFVKYLRNDYQGAIDDYTKGIEIRPDNDCLYVERSNIKYYLKDYQGAIDDYTKALEIKPNSDKYYEKRGSIKEQLKDYRGAIDDYTKAIEIKPKTNYFYVKRAKIKHTLADYWGAVDDYTKAIEIMPHRYDYYQERGFIKEQTKDYQGAIDDYTKALELSPRKKNHYNQKIIELSLLLKERQANE